MRYYTDKKRIIETTEGKVVAIATHERGAEIIADALNVYFKGYYTPNEAVQMMHNNTGNAMYNLAEIFQKEEYTAEMIIDFLKELAEERKAQAMVVSMRDELKFDKPK